MVIILEFAAVIRFTYHVFQMILHIVVYYFALPKIGMRAFVRCRI